MKNIIYHGSKNIIKEPKFGVGSPYNDFGLGFYCTFEKDMGREWSVSRESGGYVNTYSIDCEGLNILNLIDEKYTVLNWLAVLLKNRVFDAKTDFAVEARQYLLSNFLPEYDNADIIIGYRADDSYFSFARDFLDNGISLRTLSKAMKLGKMGEQFVIVSESAFERVEFVESEYTPQEKWFVKKEYRDSRARSDYKVIKTEPRSRDDIYMIQILNEEMKQNDSRLR